MNHFTNYEELRLDEKQVERIKNEMNRSDISVKQKLKFVIPLIFIEYEAEIELGNTQNLPRSWKEWKALFFKKKR